MGWFVHYIGSQLLPLDVWDDLLLPGILESRVSVGGAGQVIGSQRRKIDISGCFSWMNMPTLPCNLDACHVSS